MPPFATKVWSPDRGFAAAGQFDLPRCSQGEVQVVFDHVGTAVGEGDPHGLVSVAHLQLRAERQLLWATV
jgi:hypothetical protein